MHQGPEQAQPRPEETTPSPLGVLETLSLDDVLALGSEGSEPVDWAALVPDRSGQCPECGLADGPRHHKRCLAHPRPPSMWWAAGACVLVPLPLVLVAGPGALLFFLPLLALGLFVRGR